MGLMKSSWVLSLLIAWMLRSNRLTFLSGVGASYLSDENYITHFVHDAKWVIGSIGTVVEDVVDGLP